MTKLIQFNSSPQNRTSAYVSHIWLSSLNIISKMFKHW